MKELSTVTTQTMTSVELVKIINEMREEGQAELRHDNFMSKVLKVLGGEDALKFQGIYLDAYGREKPCYNLPKREVHLMVMSESYKVQARIYDRWQELEAREVSNQTIPPAIGIQGTAANMAINQLAVFSAFGVPLHLAQIETVKEVRKETGVDYSHVLALAPAQSNIKKEERWLEPTELARELGYKSAKAINDVLEDAGLQVKTIRGWETTEDGVSVVHAWVKGSKSGYNLKWDVEKVRELVV